MVSTNPRGQVEVFSQAEEEDTSVPAIQSVPQRPQGLLITPEMLDKVNLDAPDVEDDFRNETGPGQPVFDAVVIAAATLFGRT